MRPNLSERLHYRSADFSFIQSVLMDHAGIQLNDGKKELVYSRLAKRIRGLGLNSFGDYCNVLEKDREEVLNCINAMTTNVTSFFRESHHFEFLTNEVLSPASQNNSGEDITIWSAGCSTGQEPYSIAFTCCDFMQSKQPFNVQITATDLDSQVLQKAAQGVYPVKDLSSLNQDQLKRWFLRGKGARKGQARVADEIRRLINFSQLNLNDSWGQAGKYDVIFCRNVMIYFSSELRKKLIERFHASLKPNGCLVLGHSESLFGLSTKFRLVGRTIHQKVAG